MIELIFDPIPPRWVPPTHPPGGTKRAAGCGVNTNSTNITQHRTPFSMLLLQNCNCRGIKAVSVHCRQRNKKITGVLFCLLCIIIC